MDHGNKDHLPLTSQARTPLRRIHTLPRTPHCSRMGLRRAPHTRPQTHGARGTLRARPPQTHGHAAGDPQTPTDARRARPWPCFVLQGLGLGP